MTFEEFHPLIASTIGGIAVEYGRKGSWFGADREDFEHEMICWLLEREESVGNRFSSDVTEATKYVAKCLRNECKDHLAAQKAQAMGSERANVQAYARNELKALLPTLWDSDLRVELGTDWVPTLTDVESAFGRLSAEDRDILEAFHRDGYTNKLLAEMYGTSEANMSYRHQRALRRLQALLGGDEVRVRDPWVGRKSVTNSTARAFQTNHYNEGESA